MKKTGRWFLALLAIVIGRVLRRREQKQLESEPQERIVAEGTPERRAENVVLVLLGLAVLWAIGFVFVYAEWSPFTPPNELLGVCLAMCLACIGAALTVVARRLVVTEELEGDYPQTHPEQQQEIATIVRQSGSRFTRKRLMLAAAVGTGGALGLAAVVPALSLGPLWDTEPLDLTPWCRGVRLVDANGHPLRADDIEHGSFYTAFAEHVDPEEIASELVVLRLEESRLHLPAGRADWAPQGIIGTPRSAPTRAARSRCTETPSSRRGSRARRSSVPATTPRSIRSRAGP